MFAVVIAEVEDQVRGLGDTEASFGSVELRERVSFIA